MIRRWIYTLSFNYNDGGIRTSKTVNGFEHVYHLSGRQIETEEWGNNLLVYLYDAWGNVTAAPVNTSGTNSCATYNPFRYRGHYFDTEESFS